MDEIRVRNGFDSICVLLCAAAAVLFLISNLYTLTAGGLCIALALIRGLSTNIPARERESEKLLSAFRSAFAWCRNLFRKVCAFFRERAKYRFFKCPHCGLSLRVPRGKGLVRIHCRQCGNTFERKT